MVASTTIAALALAGVALYLILAILLPARERNGTKPMPADNTWDAPVAPLADEPMRMSALAGELGVDPSQVKAFLETKGFKIKADPPLSDSIVTMIRLHLEC